MSSAPHQERPWPRIRELVVDVLSEGLRTHAAHGLVEFDISRPMALIEEYRPQSADGLSFTAYLAYCLGHAVDQHKEMHAFRKGRRKLIVFDDVDVNTLLEKRKPDGALVPVLYVVRAANRKSLAEINHEMRQATRSDLYDDEGVRKRRRLMRLPRSARRLIWWWMRREPERVRQQWGTVALSNVGSFISPRPSWGISTSFMTCALIVGGMYDKVRWIDGAPAPRKTLTATISVDHDVVDGAPAFRFGETLANWIESGTGIDETFLKEALELSGSPA